MCIEIYQSIKSSFGITINSEIISEYSICKFSFKNQILPQMRIYVIKLKLRTI